MTHPSSHLRLGPFVDGANFLGIPETPEGDMDDRAMRGRLRAFSIRCEAADDGFGWVWDHMLGLLAEASYRGMTRPSALCALGMHARIPQGCHCLRCWAHFNSVSRRWRPSAGAR